ncbi:class I SAM-dependent methyltransferase [Ketobacter sp. MCCC 1A13808]|uniref:class I SAM-dependent methyltransferase n=1 Tax=Ketobacter sp. MCCC 1A13808 TaxID=2602738 RepID=UPI000F212B94|nr:class I SAM-dependent methyltransferase [Ketobacter sp. MCCC 1A13808]MVF10819.1 class I SAM-dependent methyltransferase [Ketobacter sp. MCCC 1A13808]RLP56223.1 MAG: class I SAM-dependent methyltransferase [Ketobacter sp.]
MSKQDNSFKDYFSSGADSYRRFRPIYPDDLYQYLATTAPNKQLAWDIGCGNGQAAIALSGYFQQVIATDASAEQIAQTQPGDNLKFFVSPAEHIDAADNSIDLITVAQAIHWFDHARFFKEVDRTLKPGGLFAAWGYQLLYTDTPLDATIERFHSEIVGPYWPPERALLDNGYTRIAFPYPRLDNPPFYMRTRWTFDELIGYLNTWSAVKLYEKTNNTNPLELHFDEIKAAWGDPKKEQPIHWPLILYAGKKSE